MSTETETNTKRPRVLLPAIFSSLAICVLWIVICATLSNQVGHYIMIYERSGLTLPTVAIWAIMGCDLVTGLWFAVLPPVFLVNLIALVLLAKRKVLWWSWLIAMLLLTIVYSGGTILLLRNP